ncbi:MAG: hypothetical protein JO013_09715 [Alphaproteobacteria bacterium]|nr:hypothetical protein [Alphaproteobacteria bacterium]
MVPAPGATTLPVPPEPRDYYGPVRACGDGFAFDAGPGEAYSDAASVQALLVPGGTLYLESWIYRGIDLSKVVVPLGAVELPGGPRLARLRVSWPDRPSEIVYHYDRGGGPLPILAIHSNRFDGSARDVDWLGRIAFGPAAKALCTSLPPSLRPSPERDDADAETLDPRPRAGPLTLCFAGLAFDLLAGETARLPWFPELKRFRLADRAGRRTDVDLRLWSPLARPRAGAPVTENPQVALMDGYLPTSRRGYTLQEDRKAHLRLVQKGAGGVASGSDPQAQFAFDPAIGKEERLAMVARLREQGQADRCLGDRPGKIRAATPAPSR